MILQCLDLDKLATNSVTPKVTRDREGGLSFPAAPREWVILLLLLSLLLLSNI